MESLFLNSYGLLNSKIGEGVAENSPLWTWQYLLMQSDDQLFKDLLSFINLSKTTTPGLYNQRPFKNNTSDDYMSPDQLIAFAAVLHKANRIEELNLMWTYLKKHLFTYDNLTGKINFDRVMQVSVILFIAALINKRWAKLLLIPLLIHSCWVRKSETSGRLKAWTMMTTLNMMSTKMICTRIIKLRSDFETWSGCFLEYFKEAQHPIRLLAQAKNL
jgi:hypothetical protein